MVLPMVFHVVISIDNCTPPEVAESPQKPRKRAYFAHRTIYSITPTFMVLGSFQGKQRFTACSRQRIKIAMCIELNSILRACLSSV